MFSLLAHPKFRRCPKSKAEHTVAIREVVWDPAIRRQRLFVCFCICLKTEPGPSDNTAFVTFDINLPKSRRPTAPEKRNSLQVLPRPVSGTNPALSFFFFFPRAGVGDRVRGFQSRRLSHDCRGIKKYSPATMWGHLYPLERDRTKNKASQIAVHEGGAKPQAPVPCTICGR